MVSKRKWNNTNSISSNNCCTFNISRNNNKFGVWLKWSNKESQEANENTKIAQVREQLELAKGPEYIEGNGKYNPDSYFERIEAEGIIGNKDTDIIDNGDGT